MRQSSTCTCQENSSNKACGLNEKLMCRFEKKDNRFFLALVLPFFILAIGGFIKIGMTLWLIPWAVYLAFFFTVIEGNVLCNHCPYWAMPGRVLKCHANYGVIKLFKYKPGPLSTIEEMVFIVTASVVFVAPLVVLTVFGEYLLLAIGVTYCIQFFLVMRKSVCSRCINFSCPVNTVPEAYKKAYMEKNSVMRKAWKE